MDTTCNRESFRVFIPSIRRRAILACAAAPWFPTGAEVLSSKTARFHFETVSKVLAEPEKSVDLAQSTLTLHSLIDPAIDVGVMLLRLDDMARSLRGLLPALASNRLTLDALRYHMFTASIWNQGRPFQYDLEDPFGWNVRNKLLTTYLATHKGNCVSMPTLFTLLARRLGLDVRLALAPNHVYAIYRDEGGQLNIETTSGGYARDMWIRQQNLITSQALASGIYMRPLSIKEMVAVAVGTLLEYYDDMDWRGLQLRVARLTQKYAPKNVSLILHERQAIWKTYRQEFPSVPTRVDQVPVEKQERFRELSSQLRELYNRAYASGWRPEDPKDQEAYQERINRLRTDYRP